MDRLQILNDRKAQVLEHLGRFTYLTVNQLVDLGIAPQARNVRDRYLRPLTEGRYPLVGFGSFYVSNRPLPRIYYLTKRGVRALAEYWDVVPETIYFPTGKIQFTRDYDHRVATVDCLISLYQWTKKQGHEIDFCDTYFQVDGSQRKQGQQLTRRPQVSLEGTTVIPDANFRLNMSDGQQRLFTLELHRQPKTQRIVEQLEVHADIIRHELLAKKYDHPHLNYILSIHYQPGNLRSVMKAIQKSSAFDDVREALVFSTLGQVKQGFGTKWTSNSSKPLSFLGL